MGILDSLKKAATDTLKKAATTATTPAPAPNPAAAAKAASLVGSKVPSSQQVNTGVKALSRAEVDAIIDAKVKARGGVSNWRASIVDLMSALDMCSSLTARKALAAKLNYSGNDADGSAEKNMWLHAELLKALAQNGGKVPSNLL
jgi:hypothetical protein